MKDVWFENRSSEYPVSAVKHPRAAGNFRSSLYSIGFLIYSSNTDNIYIFCLIYKLAPAETVVPTPILILASILCPEPVGTMQLIVVAVVPNGERPVLKHVTTVILH